MEGAPQSIGMERIANARELGGYRMTEGRTVRHGKLLRTGKLYDATPADMERLTGYYGLTLVIDMRTTDEVAQAPDPGIPGVDWMHVRIVDEDSEDSNELAAVQYTKANTVEGLLEISKDGSAAKAIYSGILDSDYTKKAYRDFFHLILENDGGTVLYHCTGGKDRTGMGSILLLAALGADDDTCLDDFVLTNVYNRRKIEAAVDQVRPYTDDERVFTVIRSLVGVSREYMGAFVEEANRRYGSLLDFVRDGIGISDEEIALLRERYTE